MRWVVLSPIVLASRSHGIRSLSISRAVFSSAQLRLCCWIARCLTQAFLLIVVGFLGGYTTFSSYTFEAITLIERGDWTPALAYILASNLVGLLATAGGM